jgi:predicted enzyme related to lactoylglutathione lyase
MGGFEAPGLIGQWTTEREPAAKGGGPVGWICADDLSHTLERAVASGGTVQVGPYLDVSWCLHAPRGRSR